MKNPVLSAGKTSFTTLPYYKLKPVEINSIIGLGVHINGYMTCSKVYLSIQTPEPADCDLSQSAGSGVLYAKWLGNKEKRHSHK